MADTDRQVFAICFGSAFAFWLILNLSQEYTVRREVTLEYLVDPGRVLVGTMPDDLEAEVTGQGWSLITESIRPGPLPVTIDIRANSDNRLTTAELKQQIQRNLSSGDLSVGYMDFQDIPVLTTPLGGKRVPIVTEITVEAAPGFVIVDSLYLSPDSVTINAANDVLEEIERWQTVPLQIPALQARAEGDIMLVKPRGGITLSQTSTLYNVRAEPLIQRTVTVPVTVINSPEGQRYQITPQTVDITVSVPQSYFNRIDVRDFRVEADAGSLRDGNFSPSIALQVVERPRQAVNVYLEEKVATYYAIQ